MQVNLVDESPPAIPVVQTDQGPDFMRPESFVLKLLNCSPNTGATG